MRPWLLVLLAACWGNTPVPRTPAPAATAHWQIADVSPAVQGGLEKLAGVMARLYTGVDPAGHMQDLAATSGVRFFVATPPAGTRTGFANPIEGKVTLCKGAACRELDEADGPIILFNAHQVFTVDALILLEHATDRWPEAFASDAAWTAFLDRVEHDPAALIAEWHATAPASHLQDHWFLLGLYLTANVLNLRDALPGGSTEQPVPSPAVCPNYTGGAETERWAAYRKADAATIELLHTTFGALAKIDPDAVRDALQDLAGDLQIFTFLQWNRREQSYLRDACPAVAGAPNALMRCRCTEADYWGKLAGAMLEPVGPPFPLDAQRVLLDLVDYTKVELTPRLAFSILLIGALGEGATTIGRHACDATTDRPRGLPALEGSRATTTALQPTAAQEADVARACR